MNTSGLTSNPLQAASDVIAGIAEQVGATVVAVHGRRRLPSSGFLWSKGVVVTAAHTIKRDGDIGVLGPDGTLHPPTLAGCDPGSDVAVLTVEGLDMEPAERGDAATLKPGHIILALGRFSENVRLDYGLVHAVGPAWRTWTGGELDRFLALDGGLRPGFSGGPIVSASGQVMGMGTSRFLRGTAAVVPASTLARVVEELLAKGFVSRGYLGIGLQPAELPASVVNSLGLSSSRGLLAATVAGGGPAEAAGILVGDILLEIAGRLCAATEDVLAVLGTTGAGKAVRVVYLRGGERRETDISLGERPQQRRC